MVWVQQRAIELLDQAFGHPGCDVGAASCNLDHGRHKFFGRGAFGDVAFGAGLEGADGVLFLGMHAEHEHHHRRKRTMDSVDQFQPAHAWHGEVNDGQIERHLTQYFECFESRTGFGDVPLTAIGREDSLEPFANYRVVIDQQQVQQSRARALNHQVG